MPVRSKSAINGTTVDVSQLAREIQADIANYRQYKAEDTMKKRAIHTSKDYGEFRNFVSVSQLKPINSTTSLAMGSSDGNIRKGQDTSLGGLGEIVRMRKDASTLSKSVAIVDNHLESISLGITSSNCANGKASLITNTLGKAPMTYTAKSSRSVDDFLRDWKRQCTSAKATLSFLTRIDSNRQLVLQPDMICEEYFSFEIDSDVLVDVIEALYLLADKSVKEAAEISSATSANDSKIDSCHEPIKNVEVLTSDIHTLHFTYSWLTALSSCGRFDLSLAFLEPADRTKLNDVCNFFKKSSNDRVAIDQLLRRYAHVL
jgi:hypothetical protein